MASGSPRSSRARPRPGRCWPAAGAPPAGLLPRFWSDQNGLRIQVCGRLTDRAEVFLTELRPRRRDTARAGVVASYAERGRLTGVVAVNAPRAFAVATRTMLAEPVAPAAVPEPAVPVVEERASDWSASAVAAPPAVARAGRAGHRLRTTGPKTGAGRTGRWRRRRGRR